MEKKIIIILIAIIVLLTGIILYLTYNNKNKSDIIENKTLSCVKTLSKDEKVSNEITITYNSDGQVVTVNNYTVTKYDNKEDYQKNISTNTTNIYDEENLKIKVPNANTFDLSKAVWFISMKETLTKDGYTCTNN